MITTTQFVKKMAKVSDNRPFVKKNLLRYKSHNTNSIPKQFLRNNIRHHTWQKHHTPASQYLSQNKTIQRLTLVATVFNDFVRRLPAPRGTNAKNAPRGTNAKNRTRDRRLGVRWINRNSWREVLLLTWSKSLGVNVTVESKQLCKNRESHSEVCLCGVSTHQWPSTQIALFGRTQEASEFLCIKTPLLLMEFSSNNKIAKKSGNAFSDTLLMLRFQDSAAGAVKKRTAVFDTALRPV